MKHRPTPPRPRPAYWWCQVAGWGVYFLVNVFIGRIFFTPGWRLISSYVFLSLLGIFFTHGFRSFIRRRDWLALPVPTLLPRVLAVNLLLAVALVFCVGVYFSVLPPESPSFANKTAAPQGPMFFVFVFNSFIIFTLWSGIYFGFAYFEQHRRLEIERYQAPTALAEAELRGLKSQLNPHFFFNSLNSLRALVLEDPARAQEAITQLAAILRYHLQSGERSLVPLAEELETVEQYLALELIRFEDRLTIELAIDPAALSSLVPPLALQGLVENAVKYGVSRNAGPAVIELSAELREGNLIVAVRNNGRLREASPNESTGVGLTNLRTRLRLLFADRAALELREAEPGWVEARLVLPSAQTLEPVPR
ncbi:MAG: sensor histidine kinase [Chthoniobacterales bacterium]